MAATLDFFSVWHIAQEEPQDHRDSDSKLLGALPVDGNLGKGNV
jgi:hypothetical protein